MKQNSTLVKRALLTTGLVLLSFAVVLVAVFVPLNRKILTDNASQAALSQTRMLMETRAQDETRFAREAELIARGGTLMWQADATHTESLNGNTPLPKAAGRLLEKALTGQEMLTVAHIAGATRAVAAVPLVSGGEVVSALVAAYPAAGGVSAWALTAGLAAALIAATLTLFVSLHKLLYPVVNPLTQLRNVAVGVADGNLDLRASETAPGEIGELGKALNNVSLRLAQNMYTFIVERNRLRQLLDGLSEGILALDEQGRVTQYNPALQAMFPEKRISLHAPDARMKLIPDPTIWQDFDNVIQTGETVTRNFNLRDMIIRLTISPTVDELDRIAGAVGLFSDITQMERLEKTRRDYVSNVSHELRTPLTAIRALIEPLKDGMVTDEADRMRYYDTILRETLRLSRLINDQLELSRLQSGTVSIEKARFALDDLVYDVCDRYAAVANEHGLALKIETDFSRCPPVYGNVDRVEQLLIILLDNAIKYTEQGTVSVSADWDAEKVTLRVSDTGIGIAEEDLPYVFDRFYKVDKAHSGKGSGLGLSIMKEVLARMDETAGVESEKGKGSTFFFTIHLKDTTKG